MTTISSSTTITDPSVYTWPITISGGILGTPVVITIGNDITLNNNNNYFIIGSEYIEFQGNNNTITIDSVTNYIGLIQNGTDTINGYSNITINNIIMTTSNVSTLNDDAGWICQIYFANNTISGTITIFNCSNNGNIEGDASGGIIGRDFGNNSTGTFTISNCNNNGNIEGNSSGGIIGRDFGYNSTGTFTISNCTNNGNIVGLKTYVGGIIGTNFGNNSSGTFTISNCTNNGDIVANDSGGISGDWVGVNATGTINIFNCANNGNVSGNYSGGIVGANVGQSFGNIPNVNISNCYSIGTLSNSTNGGICGGYDSEDGGPYTNTININNCYTLYGDIEGDFSGNTGVTFNKTYCYTPTGSWSTPTAKSTLLLESASVYVWAYQKIGGTDDTTQPFLLYSLYPTYTPVTSGVPCFKKDTKILTDKGYILIQNLRRGDLIKTLKHDYKPIHMIGWRDIYNPICEERIKDKLYVCKNEEYPEVFEDLVLTGCHSILVDKFVSQEEKEKTIEVNGDTYVTDNKYRLPACADSRAKPYEEEGSFTIYHIALENDDNFMNYGIYANGLLVETCSKRYLKELSKMTLIL